MKKHWYIWIVGAIFIAGFRVAKSQEASTNVTQQNIFTRSEKIEKAISIKQARANFPPECRAYDKIVMSAIQNRWYNLLDTEKFISSEPDKIVVTFELHEDGNVTGTKVNGGTNSVAAPLCMQAIKDCSPFQKWPDAMGSIVKTNVREIRFVFYINQKPPNKSEIH